MRWSVLWLVDGAPRFLSVPRSLRVRLTLSFQCSDLAVPRPFLLPFVSPVSLLSRSFVAHCCFRSIPQLQNVVDLTHYTLNANFQQVFSPGRAFRRKFFNICGRFIVTQHLPSFGTSGAFPFGRLTCVLSASPTSPWSTVRGTGHLYPPLALSGRLRRGLVFGLF